jgi:hypothetical protein
MRLPRIARESASLLRTSSEMKRQISTPVSLVDWPFFFPLVTIASVSGYQAQSRYESQHLHLSSSPVCSHVMLSWCKNGQCLAGRAGGAQVKMQLRCVC